MGKRTLLISITAGVLAILCLLNTAVVPWLIRRPGTRQRLEEALSNAAHRPLTIQSISWHGWLRGVLILQGVDLWEEASHKRMLMGSSQIDVEPSFWSKRGPALGIRQLRLHQLHVALRKNEDGEWTLLRFLSDGQKRPDVKTPWWCGSVGELVVDEGSVSLQSDSASTEIRLPLKLQVETRLSLGRVGLEGALHTASTDLTFQLQVMTKPEIQMAVVIPRARFRTATMENIRFTIHRSGDLYLLPSTEITGFGGTTTVQGSWNPSSPENPIKIDWKTQGIGVEALSHLSDSPTPMSGTLDSFGHVEARPVAGFLSTLNGHAAVELQDGWFGDTTGLLKIISKLNLTSVFTEVKGDHRTRVPFDDTSGEFSFTEGIASTIKPFVLENDTLRMVFMGRMNLAAGTVDGKLVVHMLLVTDEIISKIPVVNYILLGKHKDMAPMWFSVKGRMADPDITFLPIKSITAPAWNTIRHILHLPEKIYGDIKKQLPT